jgi:choline-sulfatase
MASRPNILILMADQLTAGALRCYGGKVARTPNIDNLAAEGVLFESFYTNSPLCAPSRFSFMAGQLPSRIGAYDNAAEYPAEIPTFAHYLRAAGYQTSLSGKMHFCGPDQLHGFEERLTTDIYPADFGWTPDWTHFDVRPGWYHTMDSVTQAGPCTRTNQIDFDDEVVFAARQKLFDIARGKDQRPFCMVVSMTHPHDPYTIPHEYWERYDDDEIDMPRVTMPVDELDPHSRRVRHVIGLEQQTPAPAQIRAARRAYYGAISYVDDQIGQMMQTLRDARLSDDTIVMVISDHGDMLGERGLWYKMTFFEGGCRIPLIVHAPGRFAAHRVAESASLLDLLPTLAELGNGSAPDYAAPLAGRSLLPALQGAAGPGEVLGEYLGEGAIAPVVMIRRGTLKFVHCPVDPDQLYDLATDPDERTNLAGDAAHAATVAAFRAEVAHRWSLDQVHADVLASQRRRHFVYGALRQGRFQPWDHQPVRDATRAYIRNDQELNDLEAMARFPRINATR